MTALSRSSRYAEAHVNRGILLSAQETGMQRSTRAGAPRLIAPDHARARWALLKCTLPVIAGLNEDPIALRADLSPELAALDAWMDDAQGDGHEQVGQSSRIWHTRK